MRWICFLFLLSFSCSSYSSNSAELKQSVDRFYQWANSIYSTDHHKIISNQELRENLNRIFTQDVSHKLNGLQVATNLNDIYSRFLNLRKKYKFADVILPYNEIVVDEKRQKVSISYKKIFTLTDGSKKYFHAMSFFHVRYGKLDEFNEVSSKEEDHLFYKKDKNIG